MVAWSRLLSNTALTGPASMPSIHPFEAHHAAHLHWQKRCRREARCREIYIKVPEADG